MKIKHIEIQVRIESETGKVYESKFNTIADAGRFAEETTQAIYGILPKVDKPKEI